MAWWWEEFDGNFKVKSQTTSEIWQKNKKAFHQEDVQVIDVKVMAPSSYGNHKVAAKETHVDKVQAIAEKQPFLADAIFPV